MGIEVFFFGGLCWINLINDLFFVEVWNILVCLVVGKKNWFFYVLDGVLIINIVGITCRKQWGFYILKELTFIRYSIEGNWCDLFCGLVGVAVIIGLKEKESLLQEKLHQSLCLIMYHILIQFFIFLNSSLQLLRLSHTILCPLLELLLEQCR